MTMKDFTETQNSSHLVIVCVHMKERERDDSSRSGLLSLHKVAEKHLWLNVRNRGQENVYYLPGIEP